MKPSYDHEALWIKAKLFLNRAMDNDEVRTFDERAFWASVALELLAKSALARVSPLLIADPSEDGQNLLIASGLMEGKSVFKTVRASTLYKRCQKSFQPFNETEASRITGARNEYLHGAGLGFVAIPEEAWWPRYWAQAAILVNALDKSIDDLVGSDRSDIVEQHLSQNTKNIEHRVDMLIKRAQQRLAQHRSGEISAKMAEEWRKPTNLRGGLSFEAEETCPACGAEGILEGDEIISAEVVWEGDSEEELELIETALIGSEYFSCRNCRLVLNRFELVEKSGLPQDFEVIDVALPDVEGDYGND